MSYITRLVDALLGREPEAAPAIGDAAVRARIAALELDLRERDQRIATMQKEYGALDVAARRAASGAGQDQLEQMFKKLAAPLSNLAAMASLAEAGRDVSAADLVSLFRSLEKPLKAAGLESLGNPGDSVSFDVALHQRMSGGAVSNGSAVVVRTPGYRVGAKVLLKAMVTAKEPAHE